MSDQRNRRSALSRRRVLNCAATAALAGVGTAGASGSAAALDLGLGDLGGNCESFPEAPEDFPYVRGGEEHGDFPADPDELVVFVHGWLAFGVEAAQDQAYTASLALEADGYDCPVVAYRWPSDRGWETAKRNADEYGREFADWLRSYRAEHGTRIRVIAHSLGARVSLVAADSLADSGDSFATLDLLGGAVDDEAPSLEGRFGEAVEAAVGACHNYHSASDEILDDLYENYERDEAVGENGLEPGTTPPANYDDVDVTDAVSAHCDYFRPEKGCMDAVVSNW